MQNAKLRWDVITHGRRERVCVANRWSIPFIRMTDMTCRFIFMTDVHGQPTVCSANEGLPLRVTVEYRKVTEVM